MSDIESFQIVMARKPLQGTVADNVTAWGVGGINIDGCRVETSDSNENRARPPRTNNAIYGNGKGTNLTASEHNPSGRWPANVILDSIAGAALDEQSGERKSGGGNKGGRNETAFFGSGSQYDAFYEASTGGASRFFYNSDTAEPIIERTNMHYQLLHGDNREQLKHLADNSIDSIVCDPPYELGFMGKRWDSTGIAYDGTVWTECLRVLKPGGHLIAFGGTRTYHRMTVAIEDAGFEIRDCIMWLYGSGFPKSHDVSKALDKQAGAEREVVGESTRHGGGNSQIIKGDYNPPITAPSTDLAKQWHGWGTALKPAVEPAVLARKPLIGTVADNVTTWGVGGINVDGCRVGITKDVPGSANGHVSGYSGGWAGRDASTSGFNPNIGRWPANVILDEDAGEALDEQSGWSSGGKYKQSGFRVGGKSEHSVGINGTKNAPDNYGDSGGASRFFYTAKASKAEREAGLEGMEIKNNMRVNAPRENEEEKHATHRANHHPTVKPIALMRYLVRLVTPKGGTVLDPFMGSGSTGCAAMCEGVNFVGIELSEEYLEIARRRIEYWQSQNPMGL